MSTTVGKRTRIPYVAGPVDLVFLMAVAVLGVTAVLYEPRAELPTVEQVQEMKAKCGEYGYAAMAIANAFNQVSDVTCVDAQGLQIRVKPSVKPKGKL